MHSPSEEISVVAVRQYSGHSPHFVLRGWRGGQLCCRGQFGGQCNHQLWICRLGTLCQGQGVAVSWPSTPPSRGSSHPSMSPDTEQPRQEQRAKPCRLLWGKSSPGMSHQFGSYNTGTCSGLLPAGVEGLLLNSPILLVGTPSPLHDGA